jgi:hypothetical protein
MVMHHSLDSSHYSGSAYLFGWSPACDSETVYISIVLPHMEGLLVKDQDIQALGGVSAIEEREPIARVDPNPLHGRFRVLTVRDMSERQPLQVTRFEEQVEYGTR